MAKLITSINSYKLNSKVADYPDRLLLEFTAGSYQLFSDFGMRRIFQNETYHWAEERTFRGRECKQAVVAAIDGVIYKISFRFHDKKDDDCVRFREELFNYLASQMGTAVENQEAGSTKLLIWSGAEGNVILELDSYDTALILTSSIIRNAKRDSFFRRLFGT